VTGHYRIKKELFYETIAFAIKGEYSTFTPSPRIAFMGYPFCN
jgi:hypothetical protein